MNFRKCVYGRIVWHPRFFLYFFSVILTNLGIGNHMKNTFYRLTSFNNRPISITSSISKVFETILNNHFLKHMERNSLLSDHQYGFRGARSTGDLLSYVTSIWSFAHRKFGESFDAALDISKTFDRV